MSRQQILNYSNDFAPPEGSAAAAAEKDTRRKTQDTGHKIFV
jgi:hypothetical protein